MMIRREFLRRGVATVAGISAAAAGVPGALAAGRLPRMPLESFSLVGSDNDNDKFRIVLNELLVDGATVDGTVDIGAEASQGAVSPTGGATTTMSPS